MLYDPVFYVTFLDETNISIKDSMLLINLRTNVRTDRLEQRVGDDFSHLYASINHVECKLHFPQLTLNDDFRATCIYVKRHKKFFVLFQDAKHHYDNHFYANITLVYHDPF